jgi:hypothetical protein
VSRVNASLPNKTKKPFTTTGPPAPGQLDQ